MPVPVTRGVTSRTKSCSSAGRKPLDEPGLEPRAIALRETRCRATGRPGGQAQGRVPTSDY